MKVLKPLLALLILIVIVAFLLPADLRTGYATYSWGKFLELTKKTGKAINSYKAASDAMPDNVTFCRAYSRVLNDLGEDTEDVEYYNQAYDFSHKWIEDHDGHDEIWQMYIEQARAQWGQGKKTAAKVSIDRAVDISHDDYTALVYQGIIYRDLDHTNRDRVHEATLIFDRAIEARNSTRTYWAHYEEAVAWMILRDEGRALNELEQALSQFPPRWLKIKAEDLKIEIQSTGRSTTR